MTYTYEKKPRSVSQLQQFEKCPMAWKLARVDREWKRPAAWLYQGTAVHTVAELYMQRKLGYLPGGEMTRAEAYEIFQYAYEQEVDEATDTTPNLDWWFRSGPYAGEADLERRYKIGMEQVDKLIDWIEAHPEEEIWVAPDGKPGIELEVDFELEGIRIRGFIDAVITTRDEGGPYVKIRDYKTGNKPGDDFQLAVYAVALKEMYGVDIKVGEYWMARLGKPAHPFDLTEWTREKIAARFLEMEAQLEAGEFEPKPTPDACQFCDVAYSCKWSMA